MRINGETIEAARTVRVSDRQTISVQTTAPGRDAALIFDMGRMVIGCPYFEVDGAAGAEIDVSISEYLDHGRVLAARRITSDQSTYLTDSVTLRNGRQEWKRYDYNGYRYIQLTIRNAQKPIVIHKLGTMLRNYRYAGEATFHSSDAVLDRIFEYAKWTHKVNTHWGYCGSAWREHAQWSDLAWAAMNETVFNDAGQMRYYLHQITLSQDAEGRMRFPYPGNEAICCPACNTPRPHHCCPSILQRSYSPIEQCLRRNEPLRSAAITDLWTVGAGTVRIGIRDQSTCPVPGYSAFANRARK